MIYMLHKEKKTQRHTFERTPYGVEAEKAMMQLEPRNSTDVPAPEAKKRAWNTFSALVFRRRRAL